MGPLGMTGWPGEGWASAPPLERPYLRSKAAKKADIADPHLLRCYQAGRTALVIYGASENGLMAGRGLDM